MTIIKDKFHYKNGLKCRWNLGLSSLEFRNNKPKKWDKSTEKTDNASEHTYENGMNTGMRTIFGGHFLINTKYLVIGE